MIFPLRENVWLTAATLIPYIRREPIGETSARAMMTYGGKNVTAVFSFDDKGRFVGLTTDRYFAGGANARLEQWELEATDWDTMGGCFLPVLGEVRWKDAKGDFSFYRWDITKMDYDAPGLFAAERRTML